MVCRWTQSIKAKFTMKYTPIRGIEPGAAMTKVLWHIVSGVSNRGVITYYARLIYTAHLGVRQTPRATWNITYGTITGIY